MTNATDMQAGPEFAAMIAREVMEWPTWCKGDPRPDGIWEDCVFIECNIASVCRLVGLSPDWLDAKNFARVWRPDLDIAAAMDVRACLSEGGGLRMCLIEFADFWQAAFHGVGVSGRWGTAPTAPLAICRAALAAVRNRKDKL